MGQAKQRGTPEQRKMQAIARDAVANKNFVDGVKSAEFEVCGSEPDEQVYKSADGENCQSTEFTKVFKYKRVSALVSPTGKEMVVEMMMVKCLQCGAVRKVG